MKKLTATIAVAFALALLSPGSTTRVRAQGFDSGSDGSDGALVFEENQGTIVFNPKSFNPPLDADGDNVYHFTTITIGRGTTVKLRADILGEGRPVIWLASGGITILGILDLNGEVGQSDRASVAGAGGFGGGIGGKRESPPVAGSGPGGGAIGPTGLGFPGGNAGHFEEGLKPNRAAPGPAYGNSFMFPHVGGSGGAGGAYNAASDTAGGGGGAGGGAILLASSSHIDMNQGRIVAQGGLGAGLPILGGNGSGGAIRLMAPRVFGVNPSLRVDTQFGPGTNNRGAPGRIRIETFRNEFTGPTYLPISVTTFSLPVNVFPPPTAPRVRVVRVAGTALPANPSGSFEDLDVTIDSGEVVTLELAAANIAIGTRIRLSLVTFDSRSITVETEPLVGTLESSTTTAEVRFGSGLTKVFVTATWDP